MPSATHVLLVDHNDLPIGIAEKLEAHQKGLCHRAFSIFVYRYNAEGELEILLQQRNLEKYHSAGLWTNTCCSHPAPDEALLSAAQRRLSEEMGLALPLQEIGVFHYRAQLEQGLIENEIDHVFSGAYRDQVIQINPSEVHDYRWMTVSDLKNSIKKNPEQFTAWLAQALEIVEEKFSSSFPR